MLAPDAHRDPSSHAARVTPSIGGGPGKTRTSDLRFRKPLLYPAELRDQCQFQGRTIIIVRDAVNFSPAGRDHPRTSLRKALHRQARCTFASTPNANSGTFGQKVQSGDGLRFVRRKIA
jgi:hypothetical protein